MVTDSMVLLQNKYDDLVIDSDKLRALLNNAVGDIEHLRLLLNDLYGLVGTVNDEIKFKSWKVSAGLFQELDFVDGSTYWMKGAATNDDWQLVLIDIDEIGDGIVSEKYVYFIMSSDSRRTPLNSFNGLEYEFRVVDRPL